MTVTTTPAQAEAYARRAASEGRFADAAASFAEAAANNLAQDPASVGNEAADLAQAAIYTNGSHLPVSGIGGFTRVFGSFNPVGLMTNSIEPAQLMAIGGISLSASAAWSIAAPIQKWVGGTTATLAGAGSFVSTT